MSFSHAESEDPGDDGTVPFGPRSIFLPLSTARGQSGKKSSFLQRLFVDGDVTLRWSMSIMGRGRLPGAERRELTSREDRHRPLWGMLPGSSRKSPRRKGPGLYPLSRPEAVGYGQGDVYPEVRSFGIRHRTRLCARHQPGPGDPLTPGFGPQKTPGASAERSANPDRIPRCHILWGALRSSKPQGTGRSCRLARGLPSLIISARPAKVI